MSGQKDKADDIWDKLIKDKPDNSDVMAQAANFYSNADEIEKAISLGEKSVKLAPDNTGYLQNLATFYARAEKFDKAEEALNKIRKAAKDQWLKEWADREIVNIYQRQDRLDEMKENLEAEAEAKRGDITFLKKLGEVYTRKGENEGALRVYETAVKISPDDRDVNTRLVAIYETMGKTDKAIEQTKKTIQIAPNEPYLLENLANLYNKAGNKEDSRKTWQSLISKVTNDPALYSRHAEALYGWNNLSEAIAYLDKAQAMDSGNLAYTLRKATMLMDAGKIEEAKVALGKVSIEAKEEWMKDEAKRRLDDIVEKIIVPAPVREEIKQQAMPEPVVVKMKSGQKEEEAEKPAEPEKKKKRSWFGR
jgi:tetratricopeptide (TPR) repeat protein